jgi:hypothetical protein
MTDLAIEQQAKPFEMGEVCGLIGGLDVATGLDHAVETELAQLVERGMGEHDVVS